VSYYEYAREQYDQPKENLDEIWRERLQKWRDEGVIEKQENPTRIPKARQKGYKAKKGFQIYRTRITKGGTKRRRVEAGRKPSKSGQTKYSPKKSKQVIAEQKVSSRHENLEVLDSYWVAEDGNYRWFEVITVNPEHPEIKADEDINWICDKKNRAENGLTPAAKESRGLNNRGKGAEKIHPSGNSNEGLNK
jgi:large subunit ribosomal protein L15e